MKEQENMIVKNHLENYSFLHLELSNDLPDIETTINKLINQQIIKDIHHIKHLEIMNI